ncbi:hypothetical protein GCM10010505_36320 [Kitasatospora aburaviensis]
MGRYPGPVRSLPVLCPVLIVHPACPFVRALPRRIARCRPPERSVCLASARASLDFVPAWRVRVRSGPRPAAVPVVVVSVLDVLVAVAVAVALVAIAVAVVAVAVVVVE